MTEVRTQTIGYPRIGPERQVKRALESYWKGNSSQSELLQTVRQVEEASWQRQRQAEIDFIGVGDSTLYDHVLDWAIRFGIIPDRFRPLDGLDRYFAMARGLEGIPALELTKWFDTNYHYLVPEIDADTPFQLSADDFIDTVRRAQASLDKRAVPIVLGPVTLIALSRTELEAEAVLASLIPLYRDLLGQLDQLQVEEVQMHEPALVLDSAAELQPLFEAAYAELAQSGLDMNLVTYFDDIQPSWAWVQQLPVVGFSLDFTRGDSRAMISDGGWPEGKWLCAGVVDGRNVWQTDPGQALDLLDQLAQTASIRISASCSLQFVPYTVAAEADLPDPLVGVLAFAEEKLRALQLLGRGVADRKSVEADVAAYQARWQTFRQFAPPVEGLQAEIESLAAEAFSRDEPYEARRPQQIELPLFPTTTIGSFPQTAEIRRLRAGFKRGDLSAEAYRDKIDAWIAYTIGVQEGLGLDVLVHGEFERSDMVEYFAEKLTGFAFTSNGWVQSYGSRCVRPPIIYADVTRPQAMTVREFERAQSFTKKPVKGMLTGPVTILNWSFPREDIPRREVAFQLALSLRQEIGDLEAVGARVIQVDEPALREGLPFKQERWESYLSWAVDAFRLATGGAVASTQIHTHMCYAEFGDVIGAIDRMNADVISIENARSDDETLLELSAYGYEREVGPGVYDVHSPVAADEAVVLDKLRRYRRHLSPERIWVNPDCGLKTRGWAEVLPSLQNLTRAARRARTELEEERQPA